MVIWTIIATVATYVVVDIAKSIREEKDDTYEMDVKEALVDDHIQLAIQSEIDKVELAKKEEEIKLYREELARQKAEEERIAREKEEQRLAKIEADKKAEQERLAKSTKQKQSIPKSADVASKNPNRSGNGRSREFVATAYDLSVQSCGKRPSDKGYGITASGVSLKGHTLQSAKAIAVDPNVIKLGSTVHVEFYGEYAHMTGNYRAVDTGGVIKGNIIDVFFGSGDVSEKVRQFGRRKVKVTY